MLGLSLILVGTAIAVASLYPRLQLPGVGEGFDLGFHGAAYGVLVILGGNQRRPLRWVTGTVLECRASMSISPIWPRISSAFSPAWRS